MKRYPIFLLTALCLASLPSAASAQSAAPPIVSTPAAAAPAPVPAPPAAGAVPAPLARKEETEVTPAAANPDLNLIQLAVAKLTGIPTNAAGFQAQANTLAQQLAEEQLAHKATKDELAAFKAETGKLLAALENNPLQAAGAAAGQGTAVPAEIQRAAALVSSGVASVVRGIGVEPPNASKPKDAEGSTPEESLRAAARAETDPARKAELFAKLRALQDQQHRN